MTDIKQLVQKLYAANARRDMATVQQLLDPDFEIVQTEQLPWGGHYRGLSGAEEFFCKLTAHVDALPHIDEYIEAGDRVVAVGRVRGTVRATDKSFDVRLAHVWTVHDGRALRFEAYIDTPPVLAALEPAP